MGGLSNRPIPELLIPQTGGRKVLLQISANWLEANKNVNRAHFKIYWLAVNWCNEQLYSFRQTTKWANADRAHNVQSPSSRITNVVMTLFYFSFQFKFLQTKITLIYICNPQWQNRFAANLHITLILQSLHMLSIQTWQQYKLFADVQYRKWFQFYLSQRYDHFPCFIVT